MTTIPTIDQITGNTVMQKFRSLARAVIDTLTSFGERTDYIVSDLAPRLESNLQTLSVKLVELNDTLNTTQSLQEQVTALANQVNATLDNIVRKDSPSTITALLTLANGLAVTGTTTIDGDVQITNGHSMSVAGDVDVANDLDVSGNAIIRGNTEVGGMAIEDSNGKTILSNANGIIIDGQLVLDSMSVGDITAGGMSIGMNGDGLTVLNNNNGVIIGQLVKVPTTATGTRSDDAVNGIRLQNDLDNYASMLRTTGNQDKSGTLGLLTSPKLKGKNYDGYFIQNQDIENWNNAIPPSVSVRQRLIQVGDKTESAYFFRLNLDIQSDGKVRLQYEIREAVDGALVYKSGYLI